MRSTQFGWFGSPDTWGDTARKKPTHRPGPAFAQSVHREPCDRCAARVYWDTDREGRVSPFEDGRVHLCDLHRALEVMQYRDGGDVLTQLRRAINDRRVYGAAV